MAGRHELEELSAYLEHDLEEVLRDQIEDALSKDPKLQADLVQVERAMQLLRDQAFIQPPGDLEYEILAAVQDESEPSPVPVPWWRAAGIGSVILAMAAGTLLAVLPEAETVSPESTERTAVFSLDMPAEVRAKAKRGEGMVVDRADPSLDAGEGARAPRTAKTAPASELEKVAVNREEALGGVIGAKGVQIGAGGLGTRGEAGTVASLGGLGTKGAGSGSGRGNIRAAERSTPPPPAINVEEEDELAPENTAIVTASNTGADVHGMISANPLSEEELEAALLFPHLTEIIADFSPVWANQPEPSGSPYAGKVKLTLTVDPAKVTQLRNGLQDFHTPIGAMSAPIVTADPAGGPSTITVYLKPEWAALAP